MIRDARPEDLPSIAALHAEMGMDYRLPDLDHPLFLVRKVHVNEAGDITGACFLRLTAETYLWLGGDARAKWDAMQELQPAVLDEAFMKGLDDIEARIPETVVRRFAKRLRMLGWTQNRSGWLPWSRATR